MLGVSLDHFLSLVEAVNLFPRFPGRSTDSGDDFNLDDAKKKAAELLPRLKGRTAILAGSNVVAAFGLSLAPLEVVRSDGVRWALLPHPSGLNRWYSREANWQAARRFLADELGLRFPSGNAQEQPDQRQ